MEKITIDKEVLRRELKLCNEKLNKESTHTIRAYYRGRIDSLEFILGFKTDLGFTENTISQSD